MLDAAVKLIDREGLDACTLRAVADALSVTAMALYRQVDSKDELLGQIPDHLVAALPAAVNEADDGIDALRRMGVGLASVLTDHPNAAPLFGRPEMGDNMSAAAEIVLGRLADDGHDRARAGGLLRATVALVVGLATGGGSSAEANLGPVAADALEVWLTGVRHTH